MVITRETMSTLEAKLPVKDFLRIHRSFIVAMNAIESYTSEYIEIDNRQLPVSRSYKESVIRKLQRHEI